MTTRPLGSAVHLRMGLWLRPIVELEAIAADASHPDSAQASEILDRYDQTVEVAHDDRR